MAEPITITMNDDGKFVDVDFVQWILNEIGNKVSTRAQVAETYAILIQKGCNRWPEINGAILKRWSPSGLQWIKNQAWRQAQK